MPGPFTITAATNSITLGADGRGEASFTVTNISGRAIRGRGQVRLVPDNPAAQGWLTLVGEAEGDLAIAATKQYTVRIQVPAGAPPASYTFRLEMIDVDNTDEGFSEGETVTFVVPLRENGGRKFPWWIVAVVAGVIVVAAALLYFLVLRKATMPNVVGVSSAQAAQTIEAAKLIVGQTVEVSVEGATPGNVLASTPAAGEKAKPGATVALVIALAPSPMPTDAPTNTPEPTSTETAVPTATSTDRPTPTRTPAPTRTPTYTPTPIGLVMDDFLGNWGNVDENTGGVTRLVIEWVNNSIMSVNGYGACSPTDCNWGAVNVAFTPLRVVVIWQFTSGGEVWKTTTAVLERVGRRLRAEVFDDYADPSRRDLTNTYEFERQLIVGPFVVVTPLSIAPLQPWAIATMAVKIVPPKIIVQP